MAITIKNLGYNNYLIDFGTNVLLGGKTQATQSAVIIGKEADFNKIAELAVKSGATVRINCRFKPNGTAGPATYETLTGVLVNLMKYGTSIEMNFTYTGTAGSSVVTMYFYTQDGYDRCIEMGRTAVATWGS